MAEAKSNTKRTASMMTMLEQMPETKAWKASRGFAECSKWRLCSQQKETVEHLLARCKVSTNSNYLARHTRKLMTLAIHGQRNFIWYRKT